MADTLELIKSLPAELREQILKEYIKIKLWQRKALGWDEVNESILIAPFCDRNEQIVWVLFCYKCDGRCGRNDLCKLCHRNGERHYLGYPYYDAEDYDECFQKSFHAEPLRDLFSEEKLHAWLHAGKLTS